MIDVTTVGELRREDFVKSSFSGEGTDGCLHINRNAEGGVYLWEDGDPFDAAHFTFVPNKSISAFLQGAKAGEFDDLIIA